MRSHRPALAVLALPLAALGLLAAGCGSNSASPGVASVNGAPAAATTGESATPSGAPSRGSSSGGAGGGPTLSLRVANGAKFAACMRSHGVPNFPDPNSQGSVTISPSTGINPDSPKFKAAQQACQKLLPNGGTPSPAEQAKARKQALAFSACMRAHGVPSFPDPTFSGGRVHLSIRSKPGDGLDPSSPKFQAAQKACQGNLPGAITGKAPAGK
jgi:hypothetical protein